MKQCYITLPKSFDFHGTFSLIKRAKDDPANYFIDNCWYKVIALNDGQCVILKIKPGKRLLVEYAASNDSQITELKSKLKQLLGVDDTLISQLHQFKLGQKAKTYITPYLGIHLPGYTHLFEGIIQTVLGQQVAVSAANQARKIFVMTFGQSIKAGGLQHYVYPTVDQFLSTGISKRLEQLLSMKISRTKAKAIIESSEWLRAVNEPQLHALSNDQLQAELMSIHGIGQWTSDWLLLKYFRRFEIIPAGDLAIRKAFTWWCDKDEILPKEAIMKFAKEYSPFGGLLAQRVLCAYQGQMKK